MECFFVTLALLLLQSTTPSAEMINVESAFIENEILTDLKLDLGPQSLVEITYPSGVSVNLGNILTPTQVKDVPSLKWNYEENTLYTIFMVDPDAPSRKNSTFKEVRHWLVGKYLKISCMYGIVTYGKSLKRNTLSFRHSKHYSKYDFFLNVLFVTLVK